MVSRVQFKENMKHRVGTLLILTAYFLLTLMCYVVSIQNGGISDEAYSSVKEVLYGIQPNGVHAFFILVVAVCMAMFEFSYLHSKSKMDFYQSLPITRKKAIQIRCFDNVLLFGVTELIVLVIEFIIAVAFKVSVKTALVCVGKSLLCSILIFSGIFLLTTLAMILTGHKSVGFLGSIVMGIWLPVLVRYMVYGLSYIFLDTFTGDFLDSFGKLNYGSPFSLAFTISTQNGTNWLWKDHIIQIIVLWLWIVWLAIITQKLYQIRPSEAAENSMAFPIANPIIRNCIVIPSAILIGCVLYDVNAMEENGMWWFLLGTLGGAIIIHGIVEIIFQMNVRALWSHRVGLFITLALMMGIMGSFRFDIYGYDTFSIKAEKVKMIMPASDLLETRQYEFWGEKPDGIYGKEKDEIIQLVKDSIVDKKDAVKNGDIITDADGKEQYTSMIFSFYMKNGDRKDRVFYMTKESGNKIMNKLLSLEQYRKMLYSIYTIDLNEVTEITYDYCNFTKTIEFSSTEEEKKFIDIYKSELDTLTYEEMENVLPVGSFQLNHKQKETSDYGYGYDGTVIETDTYYLYPSFQKSIAFLKQKNYQLNGSFADANINTIRIEKFSDSVEETVKEIKDEKLIKSIQPDLYPMDIVPEWYKGEYAQSGDDYDIYVTGGDSMLDEISTVTNQKTINKLNQWIK